MTIYSHYSNVVNATTFEVVPPFTATVPDMLVFWYVPPVVMAARVNMPVAVYPVQQIVFDNVTEGSYAACEGEMFFTLGSTPGGDDLGRGRLRSTATSSILKVGRSSRGYEDGQLTIVDNSYLTVYRDFRIHAKPPYIKPDGEILMDGDIAVGDWPEKPPPVANTGPSRARTINPDTGLTRVYFPGSSSFAVAPGATITAYAWDVGAGGTIVLGGSASDPDIYADFEAGAHIVALTVTDSNGKSHTARCLIYAHDPDNSLCIAAQVTNITRGETGQTVSLRLLQDLPRSEYADGGHILVWQDIPQDPDDYYNMIIDGWHEGEQASMRAQETHLQRETEITVIDAAGRLAVLPGFSISLEVPDEDDEPSWSLMSAPNLDLYMCFIGQWFSTALAVVDFMPSGTWDDYPFVIFKSDGSSLFDQMQRKAHEICYDHDFVCNRWGQLRVVPDPMLRNPADRPAGFQAGFIESAWSEIEFNYRRSPRVHTLRASAMLTATEWTLDEDGKKTLLTAFSRAPGTAPGQGTAEQTQGEQLAQSQQQLNEVTGHRFARLNSRYERITLTPPLGDDQGCDPADKRWVHLVTTAASAPQRGIEFETIRCQVKEVSIDFTYSEEAITRRSRLTLEIETSGEPALTEVQDDALPVGEEPEVSPFPPSFGLITGQQKVWGMGQYHGYRTSDFQAGSPTWARVDLLEDTSEEFLSWVVDPFSPGYLNGTGAINGWAVTQAAVYRLTDLFGTTTIENIYSFPVALTGPTQFRTIQASFGAYFESGNPWLMVVSHYADESGHVGTWALRSMNGGATFEDEVQISAGYATVGDEPSIPAIYLSPKTPGYALATAYLSGQGAGYASYDWGASWATMGGMENPDELLPAWAILDEGDDASPDDDVYNFGMVGLSYTMSGSIVAGPYIESSKQLILAPSRADTVRMVVRYDWEKSSFKEGLIAGTSSASSTGNPVGSTHFHNGTNNWVGGDTPGSGTFEIEWYVQFPTDDWPVLKEDLQDPLAEHRGSTIGVFINANGFGEAQAGISYIMRGTVTEIELRDGTIYVPSLLFVINPGERLSGDMHVPWKNNDSEDIIYHSSFISDNRQFRLIRINGTTIDDISPTDGDDRSYGFNKNGFAIRAYDSNRVKMLVGGRGNDDSSDAGDDKVGLWYSEDGGNSWDELIAPTAASAVLRGISAAFGGDDSDIMFVWGGWADSGLAILYSDDTGETILDKTGNLESLGDGEFGEIAFLGIAGGPIS